MTVRMSVDLPEPFVPTSASELRAGTTRSMPLTTTSPGWPMSRLRRDDRALRPARCPTAAAVRSSTVIDGARRIASHRSRARPRRVGRGSRSDVTNRTTKKIATATSTMLAEAARSNQ